MKVVIAIDSLKNSLTSVEAGRAIEAGVRKAYGSQPVQIVVKPLADGGEGTVEALVEGMNGELRSAVVQGPLGNYVSCSYGYLPETRTAVIEMAGAAGLGLVPEELRNPSIRRPMVSARSWPKPWKEASATSLSALAAVRPVTAASACSRL